MTALGHEVRLMQNPALGAVLLWRFATAYSAGHPQHAATPLPLLFIVLAAVWHEPTAANIASTQMRSGLRAFAAKFTESSPPQLDALLDLHERARRWRPKTREALRVGLATGLLRLDEKASVIAGSTKWTPDDHSHTNKVMAFSAEKFGAWCAALTLHEISLALHVKF